MLPYTLLFLSSGTISIPLLKALATDDRCKVVGLICQPDKAAGRGQELLAPATKSVAIELGIPVYQPEKLSREEELLALFKKNRPDFLLTFAYGQILTQEWLDLPKIAPLNVHPSLLPAYRGPTPYQAALAHGDENTGITLMKMVRAMDAGPIYSQQKLHIEKKWMATDLHDAIAEKTADFVPDDLAKLFQEKDPIFLEQDASKVSVCGLLTKESGRLDLTQSAEEVFNRYRAYTPWPGLWAIHEGKRLKILGIEQADSIIPSGELRVVGGEIFLGTRTTALKLTNLQMEGKKALSASEFLKGAPHFGGVLC